LEGIDIMMDISTPMGSIIITVLRLAHIVAGVIWVGGGITFSLYFGPALGMSGVDAGKVIRILYTKVGFDKLMMGVSITTTVAGLILYALNPPTGGFGIVLGIGALVGLGAFGHGAAVLGKLGRQIVALAEEAGDEPNEEQQKQFGALSAKMMKHGRISMWLGIVAVVFMSSARYVDPLIRPLIGG
jgi:hypothetical protein